MPKLAQFVPAWDSGSKAQFVPMWVEAGTPTFSSPADRGTLDLVNCSYVDNIFTFRSRWDNTANSAGARFLFARISGVLGMTPEIRLVRANLGITVATASRFVFSYDGITWIPFTNRSTTTAHYICSNDSAFVEDSVFVALWPAWPVGRTLPWIESLLGSGYVSNTPSTTGFVFNVRSATVNEIGEPITATPLYAFKVGSSGLAPDGSSKRNMVMMAGVHASEDVGNYSLKGAVEFLVSEDPQAQLLRSWFNTYVYPVVASAGRKGGSTRGDFQTGYMKADINRNWEGSTFETLEMHKVAILADTGGEAEVFFDFHGDMLNTQPSSAYVAATDQATWQTAIRTYIAGLRQDLLTDSGYSVDWAETALSPSIAIIGEYIYGSGNTNQVGAETYGANHMRAIALLANQEYFGTDVGITGTVTVVESGFDTVRATATLIDVQATVPPTGVLNFVGHVPTVTTGAPLEELSDVIILINSHVAKKTYVGDTGSSLLVDFGMDIADASEYHIEVKKPDGTELVWPARIVGTNHIAFNTLPATFDQAGIWKLQAKVRLPNGKWSGKTADLQVWPAFR